MSATANATLCAHSGATQITRESLALIPVPESRGTRHLPIPHADLVDTIESQVNAHGFEVDNFALAVRNDGLQLFGTAKLTARESDYQYAIGFRSANDQTMSLQLVSGLSVFVCDNMALRGDVILCKRHTTRLDLGPRVYEGLAAALEQFDRIGRNVEALKNREVSDNEAKAVILDAALAGIMPLRLLPKVTDSWLNPPHAEFAPRTAWSLHNAFTEGFKDLRPHIAQQAAIELGQRLVI